MPLDKARAAEIAKDNLLSVFNERDKEQRWKAIERTYAKDVILHEPDSQNRGHDAVDKASQQLLDRSPGWGFKPAAPPMFNHNMITMPFEFGPSDEPSKIKGRDVMLVGDNGLVTELYVLLEGVNEAPSQK